MGKGPEAGMSEYGPRGRAELCIAYLCRRVPPGEQWWLPPGS